MHQLFKQFFKKLLKFTQFPKWYFKISNLSKLIFKTLIFVPHVCTHNLRAFTLENSIPSYFTISKKLLYQLYHTILQYSQHPNFYFTIQHIKILFLHNKIIYPKTQIKVKTQNPKTRRERERGINKISD